MKIESGRNLSATGAARRAGQTAAPGFTPELQAPVRPTAASSARAVTALDAILALQSDERPARRARQLKRGHAALDALEQLARGIALGGAPASLRAELEHLSHATETTGEGGLDAALLEIDTRLAVELAKLDMTRQAARGRT